MPNDPTPVAPPVEIRTGSAVAPPTRGIDVGNLLTTIGGVGLATWLVTTQIPEINKNLQVLKDANEAHYRAISDDRRIQFDDVRRKLDSIERDVQELRRETRLRERDRPKVDEKAPPQ